MEQSNDKEQPAAQEGEDGEEQKEGEAAAPAEVEKVDDVGSEKPAADDVKPFGQRIIRE